LRNGPALFSLGHEALLQAMAANDDRRGAAYHEAGHAVVAWALGLQIGLIVIGIDRDDARGGTDIDSDQSHLSQIDRIAICVADLEAQELFQAPLHDLTALRDLSMVIEIIGEELPEGQNRRLRRTASRRARELILQHQARVARLATRLIERSRVTPDEFIKVMKGT
jgi:ATP-dependent Zn protease